MLVLWFHQVQHLVYWILQGTTRCPLTSWCIISFGINVFLWIDLIFDRNFFPAEQSGGIDYLSALVSPLPDVKFCPTGGITLENSTSYLSLKNVLCVGGSWIASLDLIKQKNWTKIEENARITAKLK